MIRSLLALALIVTFGSSARADWQYVKWGMSRSAAINASKGEAKFAAGSNVACALNSQKPFATIPKKLVDGFDVRVTLCTDGSDKVTSVALSPVNPTALPALRRALITQFGQPAKLDGTEIWNDRRSGNAIAYYENGGTGRIEYKKIELAAVQPAQASIQTGQSEKPAEVAKPRPGLDLAKAEALGFKNMLR